VRYDNACDCGIVYGVDLEVRAKLSALDAHYLLFRSLGILLRLPLEGGVGSGGSTICVQALHCVHAQHTQLDCPAQVGVTKVLANRHRYVKQFTSLLLSGLLRWCNIQALDISLIFVSAHSNWLVGFSDKSEVTSWRAY